MLASPLVSSSNTQPRKATSYEWMVTFGGRIPQSKKQLLQ